MLSFSAVSVLIPITHILPENDSLGYISLTDIMGMTATTFNITGPRATEFGEIMQNNSHCAVHGHSRSPILVPIESHMQLPVSQ